MTAHANKRYSLRLGRLEIDAVAAKRVKIPCENSSTVEVADPSHSHRILEVLQKAYRAGARGKYSKLSNQALTLGSQRLRKECGPGLVWSEPRTGR